MHSSLSTHDDPQDIFIYAAQRVKSAIHESVNEIKGGQDLLAECLAFVTVRAILMLQSIAIILVADIDISLSLLEN